MSILQFSQPAYSETILTTLMNEFSPIQKRFIIVLFACPTITKSEAPQRSLALDLKVDCVD